MTYFRRRYRYVYENPKVKLSKLFTSYAEDGQLNKEQLKNAFEHLDAAMPHKQAEEAMSVADNNYDNLITCHTKEFTDLVEYAYNKGFGSSI